MPYPAPETRAKLLARAQHLRALASAQLDPRLRDTALELAEEYEQLAAETDPKGME